MGDKFSKASFDGADLNEGKPSCEKVELGDVDQGVVISGGKKT